MRRSRHRRVAVAAVAVIILFAGSIGSAVGCSSFLGVGDNDDPPPLDASSEDAPPSATESAVDDLDASAPTDADAADADADALKDAPTADADAGLQIVAFATFEDNDLTLPPNTGVGYATGMAIESGSLKIHGVYSAASVNNGVLGYTYSTDEMFLSFWVRLSLPASSQIEMLHFGPFGAHMLMTVNSDGRAAFSFPPYTQLTEPPGTIPTDQVRRVFVHLKTSDAIAEVAVTTGANPAPAELMQITWTNAKITDVLEIGTLGGLFTSAVFDDIAIGTNGFAPP